MSNLKTLAGKNIIVRKIASLLGSAPPKEKDSIGIIPIDDKDEVIRLKDFDDFKKVQQGQVQFWYGDNFVWARNQENADRKAGNLGYC